MNALVTVPSATGLPAQAKPQLQQLAKRLDVLTRFVDEMEQAHEALCGAPPDRQFSRIRLSDKTSRLRPRHVAPKRGEAYEPEASDKAKLANAKFWLTRYRESRIRNELLNGDFLKTDKALRASLPEEAWWGDDDKVKQTAVVRAVGMLLSSFPQAVANAEIFAAQMIEDVHELQPHPFVVEDAWRKLRHTQKFTPAISEVRAAYQAALQTWMKRWDAEEFAEDRSEELATLIARTEEKEQARAVLRARQNSRRDAKQHPEAVEAAE